MSLLDAAAGKATIVALPADFDRWQELLDLILLAFSVMDGIIDPPSSAHRLSIDSLRRKAAEERLVLALEHRRIVGCVFAATRQDVLYIGKLAVAPDRQGHGIGRRLIAAVEAFAGERGMVSLELQTRIELTGNQKAFARMGFREIARTAHPGYQRPTSITMRKELVPQWSN